MLLVCVLILLWTYCFRDCADRCVCKHEPWPRAGSVYVAQYKRPIFFGVDHECIDLVGNMPRLCPAKYVSQPRNKETIAWHSSSSTHLGTRHPWGASRTGWSGVMQRGWPKCRLSRGWGRCSLPLPGGQQQTGGCVRPPGPGPPPNGGPVGLPSWRCSHRIEKTRARVSVATGVTHNKKWIRGEGL